MTSPNPSRPSPMQTAETKPFWDASARGELLYGSCSACNEKHYYPRARCPYCFSDQVTWRVASGRGTLYSYSAVPRGNPPYVSAYVMLEEGVAVFTNMVECNPGDLSIGLAVELVFEKSRDGQPVAVFRPAT